MMNNDDNKQFDSDYTSLQRRIEHIDPVNYSRTRNFADGAVTRLSPYISRGVLSTRMILQRILQRDLAFASIEKFIQELAWRDYWQQVWKAKGEAINSDLKHPQQDVIHHELPRAIKTASTGIVAVDDAIQELYRTGYMHNHMRMYTGSLACNIGKGHWRIPAQWMYYHLLDGDWASNALSWQWVAGCNANKKYIANQDNINKYFYSKQKQSFLDEDYAELARMSVPESLRQTCVPDLDCDLPVAQEPQIDRQLPTLIYNYYNLDAQWRSEQQANRILLLEPSLFRQYPVAQKNLDFIMQLANNIPSMQLFIGEFEALYKRVSPGRIHYKEHPLNRHYKGSEEPRDWMFEVEGYYPSFFAFWKQCKREIKSW